jgi:protoheme IX farnesyltransferase
LKAVSSPGTAAALSGVALFVRDLVQLAKPRLTGLVVFTFGGGVLLAPVEVSIDRALMALVGTTLLVAAANAINMYLERDVDGLMRRTRRRPLPEGRIAPFMALSFGAMLASAALPLLLMSGGLVVTSLGLLAFYTYVWGYTPLKRRTSLALYLGAIPGALPPLMGWATATGRIDAGGLALFGILFVWQIPHFAAIAAFRETEYAQAGLKVLSLTRTPRLARATVVLSSLALVAVSLALVPLQLAGVVYAVLAVGLGLGFLRRAVRVLRLPGEAADATAEARDQRRATVGRWARSLFLYSLVYLTGLFFALGLDRLLGLS